VTARASFVNGACALSIAVCACGVSVSTPAARSERTIGSRSSLARVPVLGDTPRVMSEGEDAARRALFALLEGLVSSDVEGLRRVIDAEPCSVHSLRASGRVPDALVPTRREVVLQRLIAGRRAASLPEGLVLRDVVDPERVVVETARERFTRLLPSPLEGSDLLVHFEVDEAGARALQAVSSEGRGLIIVRVSTLGALVVGL